MNLLDGILNDNLFVDFGSEIFYGFDQANISSPCRFATVSLPLVSTSLLAQSADRIRKSLGFAPMHPMDEYTDDTCDNDGWYDFYIGLNDFTKTKLDSCIAFTVVNSDSEDNEASYCIDLSEYEQRAVFARIDDQCRRYLGKGCEDLLAEARREMADGFSERLAAILDFGDMEDDS